MPCINGAVTSTAQGDSGRIPGPLAATEPARRGGLAR